jgi:hypothetical protein
VPRTPTSLWPVASPPPSLPATLGSATWLTDRSLWVTHVDHRVRTPDISEIGAYGVGNGLAFAINGTAYPLNTLHDALGPTYQISDGYFGDISSELRVQGNAPLVNEEWIAKPRHAAAILSTEATDQGTLTTLDFAPPGHPSLVRIIVVANTTASPLVGVQVATSIAGGARVELNRIAQDRGIDKISIGGLGSPAGASGSTVTIPLGTILPGAEAICALALVTTLGGAGEAQEIQALENRGVWALLDDTRAFWQSWFAAGAQLKLPDPMVQDLVEDMETTCKVQQAATGGLSPMSRYTKCFLRDSEGPERLFLDLGRPSDVQGMVNYLYKGCIIEGLTANSIAVDHDPTTAGPPPDWTTAPFMPTFHPVESPSYVAMNLISYWKATGDTALASEQFGFAREAILRQEVHPNGLMGWNGDEPFRWVFMNATGLFNNENNAYGPHSSFLLAPAGEHLAVLAGALGRTADQAALLARAKTVRDAVDQNAWLGTFYSPDLFFWGALKVQRPFEDINLLPLHTGFLDPQDPRAESNLLETYSQLGRGPGRIQSPSIIANIADAYDGMVPGYFLENLTLLEHPDAEAAFNAIGEISLTSGETAEGMWFQGDRALILQYFSDGKGAGDTTARYRPWEGGINVFSLVRYLLGETLDATGSVPSVSLTPHLPNNWGTLEAHGLRCGAATFDVVIGDSGTERRYQVTNTGSVPLTLELVVAEPSVSSVSLNWNVQSGLATRSKWGRTRVTVPVGTVAPGTSALVSVLP